MSPLSADELEQRLGLLTHAFDTITEIDRLRSGQPVTASTAPRGSVGGSMPARMADVAGRPKPSPTQSKAAATPVTITAAETAGSTVAGTPLTSSGQLAELMSDQLRTMDPVRMPGTCRKTSALVRWSYPEERKLGNDVVANTQKLDAVCGLTAGRYNPASGALVASGGICLPVAVVWDLPVFSTADRPLRDGLPAFEASRGGLRFVQPPDIGIPSLEGGTASGAGTSTTVWSEAIDADPAGQVKPVWTVACGSEELVYVGAVTTRVQFGNMTSRFFPEQIAANTEQAVAVSARQAELNLLTQLADSSKQLLPRQYLGASRDILATLDLTIEQYKQSHRIPDTASFSAVFPSWAKGIIRADLLREVAHDNAGSRDIMAVSDAEIESWFAVRNCNVIWTLDSLQAGTYGTGGQSIPTQYFSLATAGAQPTWPSEGTGANPTPFVMAWFLYVEGTFQFLDGGRLDLGVVRDSLLDSTNSYEIFSESFEALAMRGLEAYQIQQPLFPAGGSAGTVAVSTYGE